MLISLLCQRFTGLVHRFFVCCWLLLLIGLATAPALHAQTVNVEAVTRYWQLTDGLRQNLPITDAAWNDFINLPGNKTYIRNSFLRNPLDPTSLERYRQALETVYMPQNDSLLQAKLRAHEEPYVLVNDYKQRESVYRDYVREAVQSPKYSALMYTLAYEYLPTRAHTTVNGLRIYYTALSNNATSQPDGIFFSLKAAVDNDEPKPGIVEAHEMHHQLVPTKEFSAIAPEDKSLFWVLRAMRSEGIADLIDKTVQHQVAGDPHHIQALFLDPAPRAVQQLDSLLQAIATRGAAASQPISYYVRLFNGAGHVPGYYMARVIEVNGYLKPWIATLDNPFTLIYNYQKAARKAPNHPPQFSRVALKYLKKLEKKYSNLSPQKV